MPDDQQLIKLNQPGSQLTLEVGPGNIPALAVPTAWLLQLYATLDNQPNSHSVDTLKHDLETVLERHASLLLDDLKDINVSEVYEYELTLQDDEGHTTTEVINATDDGHAFEEASYEFDDKCIAVKRGERLPDPQPWHQWP